MLPGDCCLQAKPSRRAERRGARGSSGRRGARSHVLRGSWGRGPSGGEKPPATHWVPWDGARRGAGAGKQHQGFGCFFCAVPGHGAAPGPPGVTPQPRRAMPRVLSPFPSLSFPFYSYFGWCKVKVERRGRKWILLLLAPGSLCLGHDGHTGTVPGWEHSPRISCGISLGWQGHPTRLCPTLGGTQHHAQSPRIHPSGITWGERTQKPSCSPCTRSLSQQNCFLPQSLCVGTALF